MYFRAAEVVIMRKDLGQVHPNSIYTHVAIIAAYNIKIIVY